MTFDSKFKRASQMLSASPSASDRLSAKMDIPHNIPKHGIRIIHVPKNLNQLGREDLMRKTQIDLEQHQNTPPGNRRFSWSPVIILATAAVAAVIMGRSSTRGRRAVSESDGVRNEYDEMLGI